MKNKWKEFLHGYTCFIDKGWITVEAYRKSFGIGISISFGTLLIDIGHIVISIERNKNETISFGF